MTDNSQQKREPLPPQRRKLGLGWLPDYPDLRDYRLGSESIQQEDGKLQEETTETFTQLIEAIAALPQSAANFKVHNKIKALQQKLSGNTAFFRVKIYKILREKLKPETPFSSKDFIFESDSSKRIFEIKNYLYILFQCADNARKEIESEEDDISKKLKKTPRALKESYSAILNNPRKAIEWLNTNEFTNIDADLIKLFQYCTGEIVADGIVGLETYTALNNYLQYFSTEKDKEKIASFVEKYKEQLKNDFAFLGENFRSYYPKQYNPKIKLVSIPVVIPNEALKVILEEFKSWASKQISSQKNSDDIFETTFLRKIKQTEADIFQKAFDKDKLLVTSESVDQKRAEEFINQLSNKYFEGDSFFRIFREEFKIVEPIFSIILKLMCPLVQYSNYRIEDVARSALKCFLEIFDGQQHIDHQSSEIKLEFSTRDISQALKRDALSQVVTSIEIEIEHEINQYKKSEDGSVLFFYYLLLKVAWYFLKCNGSSSEKLNPVNKQELNPFSKQELFELILTDPSGDEGGKAPLNSFFEVPQLNIPLDTQLIKNNIRDKKLFFFLPGVVDLSYWCSEIEDQGQLNSCTAFAGIALLEYFMNRATGEHTDVSPLFLYKVARDLMKLSGDVGASVRETMKAMTLFGVPPEEYWEYNEKRVDDEPPSFCFSYAQNYQALKYFRLDYAGISKEVLLLQIKAVIAAGFPCVFGFTLYTSASEKRNYEQGIIPFPNYKRDRVVGGHSVVAVGYDDYKQIERLDRAPNEPSTGAFLIRNSIGAGWGNAGYGWIPYDYVLAGLTADWWSLLKAEWFQNDRFWQGQGSGGGPTITKP